MAPKNTHISAMIEKTEEKIATMQESLASGTLTPDQETETLASIEDQVAKVERLQALLARLDAVKKGK